MAVLQTAALPLRHRTIWNTFSQRSRAGRRHPDAGAAIGTNRSGEGDSHASTLTVNASRTITSSRVRALDRNERLVTGLTDVVQRGERIPILVIADQGS